MSRCVRTLCTCIRCTLIVAGMTAESDCTPCLGGFYCFKMGSINFDFSLNDTGTGPCSAGHFCKSGASFTCQTADNVYQLCTLVCIIIIIIVYFTLWAIIEIEMDTQNMQSIFVKID